MFGKFQLLVATMAGAMIEVTPDNVFDLLFADVSAQPQPTDQFISLTTAICWLASGRWQDAPTLRYALDRFYDDAVYVAARESLQNGADRFLAAAADEQFEVRGKLGLSNSTPLAIHPHELVGINAFREFRRYDYIIDGLGRGCGLAAPPSADENYLYRPAPQSYCDVRVERDRFMQAFTHTGVTGDLGLTAIRRGRPPGSGSMTEADVPFLRLMGDLIAQKKARSPNHAALLIVNEHGSQIAGNSADGKITRLGKSYRALERK